MVNILHALYPTSQIDHVGQQKETGDIILSRPSKPKILVENKNWGKNVVQEEIKKFIKDKIDNQDMFGMVLWVYASMELEDGNTEKARELFERGRNNGARGKWIFGVLRNKEAAEKLTKSLESLGSLD